MKDVQGDVVEVAVPGGTDGDRSLVLAGSQGTTWAWTHLLTCLRYSQDCNKDIHLTLVTLSHGT